MRFKIYLVIMLMIAAFGCNSFGDKASHTLYKGVYTGGPVVKSFKDCDSGQEYWATDRSSGLESKYEKLNAEKEYSPVYAEVEGEKIKSGKEGKGSELDSTIVITRVIKITREIPQDMCN